MDALVLFDIAISIVMAGIASVIVQMYDNRCQVDVPQRAMITNHQV